MKLIELELKNFRSFGDCLIDLRSFQQGVCLIRGENKDVGGSNGAGKTAICDAIFWCLTGKFYLRTRNSLVKNANSSLLRHGTSQMSVRLVYEHEGLQHEVRREFSPTALWFDGAAIDSLALCKTLPVPPFHALGGYYFPYGYYSYLFRIYRGSRRMVESFIYSGGGLVFVLFGRILQDMADKLAKENKELLDKMRSLGELFISKQKTSEIAERALETAFQGRKRLLADQVSISNRIKETTKELEKLMASDLPKTGATKIDTVQEYGKVAIENRASRVESAKKIVAAYLESKQKLSAALSHFRNHPQVCPVCEHPMMPDKYKDFLRGLIADVRQKRKKLFNSSLRESLERIKEQEAAISELIARSSNLDAYRSKKEMLDTFLEGEAQIKVSLEQAERQFQTAKKDHQDVEDEKAQLEKQIEEIKGKIESVRIKNERCQFWSKWAQAKAHQSVTEFCNILGAAINSILETLKSEINIEIGVSETEVAPKRKPTFAPSRTTPIVSAAFNKIFVNFKKNGYPIHPMALSSGEFQRCNLAAALAMMEVNQCDFMMMDEPAIAFDPEGNEALYEVLNSYARSRNKQLFIIDHSSIGNYPYDAEIEVVKQEGTSRAYLKLV